MKRRKKPDLLPYDEWKEAKLTLDQQARVLAVKERLPDHIYINGRYEVWVFYNVVDTDTKFPQMHWLSIKRADKDVLRDWRDLQRIKNDIIGDEHEGMELFPAESRLTDTSNQFHLFVLAEKGVQFPFGYGSRLVCDEHNTTSRQRAFELTPSDLKTEADLIAMEEEEKEKRKQERGM